MGRTRFDAAIINNAFQNITPKFFYDILNIIGMKLKTDGILFFSVPEEKGISKAFGRRNMLTETGARIDEFTLEYILQNTGYDIVDKGVWDKLEPFSNQVDLKGANAGSANLIRQMS